MGDYIEWELIGIENLTKKGDAEITIRVHGEIDNKIFDFDNLIKNSVVRTYDDVSELVARLLSRYYSTVEDKEIAELIKAHWLMNIEGVN